MEYIGSSLGKRSRLIVVFLSAFLCVKYFLASGLLSIN